MTETKPEIEKAEMQVFNSGEANTDDKCDHPDASTKNDEVREAEVQSRISFFGKMEHRIKELFGWLKLLFLVGVPALLVLFLIYNTFATPQKAIPEETMNKLLTIMKMQGGGNFAPIIGSNDTSSST